MLVLMARDTRMALGVGAALCDSRTLWLDRFGSSATPGLQTGEPQNEIFHRAIRLNACLLKLDSWQEFLLSGISLPAEELLFGRLEARLILNTSAGIMDNAGLPLDRLTGVPCLPGSAIKGCARRAVIHGLSTAEPPEEKVERLVKIARVFGWTDSDWREASDFAWACGNQWPEIRLPAQQRLWQQTQPDRNYSWLGWQEHCSSSAGTVQFLPAYPWESPPGSDLELDVTQCHHPSYYQGHPRFAAALDTEDPVSRTFLAVAPQHVFAFAILGPGEWRPLARQWLQEGLSTFGLGARTTSGYGGFDTSAEIQNLWRTKAVERQQHLQSQHHLEQEILTRAADEESRRKTAEELKRARDKMTPDQLEDFKLAALTDEQFRTKLQHFPRHLDKKELQKEQLAIVRALCRDRLGLWEDLKLRAPKSGLWAQVVEAVRLKAKKANLGKMP